MTKKIFLVEPKDNVSNLRLRRYRCRSHRLVEAVALNSETGEEMVVYRQLYGDGGLWVRPLKMFTEEVDRQKYPDAAQRFRFELVETDGR